MVSRGWMNVDSSVGRERRRPSLCQVSKTGRRNEYSRIYTHFSHQSTILSAANFLEYCLHFILDGRCCMLPPFVYLFVGGGGSPVRGNRFPIFHFCAYQGGKRVKQGTQGKHSTTTNISISIQPHSYSMIRTSWWVGTAETSKEDQISSQQDAYLVRISSTVISVIADMCRVKDIHECEWTVIDGETQNRHAKTMADAWVKKCE